MEITREAEADIDRQEGFDRRKLAQEIKERLSGGKDNENIGYVHKPEFGLEFQKLKLKTGDFDHRIYFDYIDSQVIVFAVRHRDYAYSQEDLQEIEQRLRNI